MKEWYEKSTPRSVEALQLWVENPRLNPDAEPSSLKDYVAALLEDDSEKSSFYDLLRSIAKKYIPLDPIVVWKNESGRFSVAEGNRRVLALKLLVNPNSAPKGIRSMVRKLSESMPTRIEKIPVYVAPSFDDAIWYINQRNNSSSMRKPWSRLQQFRWITSLYEKYGDDIEQLQQDTNMTAAEIEADIRTLKLINLIHTDTVIKSKLLPEEYERAISHKFPVSIIERFFGNVEARKQWGVEFDKANIILKNRAGFIEAYATLVKNIVSTEENHIQIDTRINTKEILELLEKLPKVDLGVEDGGLIGSETASEKEEHKEKPSRKRRKSVAGDPNRNNVIANNLILETADPRLIGIFNELKKISPNVYVNATAASLRIFLDVAVLNYIQSEGLEAEIQAKYRVALREIVLSKRLTFIAEKLAGKEAAKVIGRLLNESNEYSLDVLNGYQHSKKTCYLDKKFINGFWDFMFPLFQELLDIKEV